MKPITTHINIIIGLVSLSAFTIQPLMSTEPSADLSNSQAPYPAEMQHFTAIYGQMMDGLLGLLSKPETAQKLAHYQKTYYDALIKEGFPPESALQIVTSTPIPFMQTSK